MAETVKLPESTDVIPGDILIPWKTFVTKAKQFAGYDASDLSMILQAMGVILKDERKYILLKQVPHFFPELLQGDTITFSKVNVHGDTLLNSMKRHQDDS